MPRQSPQQRWNDRRLAEFGRVLVTRTGPAEDVVPMEQLHWDAGIWHAGRR